MTHEEFEDAQSVIGKQKERGFVQDSGFSLKGKVTCGNCKLKMMYNYGAVPVGQYIYMENGCVDWLRFILVYK